MPSGFIGVDVFFVISGYVVTASLLRDTTGSAVRQVLGFWRRRVARIYPALVICILATLAATLLFLPEFPLVQYNASIRTGLSALFGLGNIYLDKSQQNYFTADQSNNPFLHTWSLGVEEQFYLVFSVAFIAAPLLFVDRFFKNKTRVLRASRIAIVLLVTLGSACFMLLTDNPLGSYYLLAPRLWELGVGALLAQLMPETGPSAPRPVRQALSIGAFAAILCMALMPIAGGLASVFAVAVSATAVLIWADGGAVGPDTLVASLFSLEPIRRAGLLSYSLYLWHWPVIVLFSLTVGLKTVACATLAALCFSLLATISYAAVERPLRRAPFRRIVLPVVLPLSAAIALGTVAEMRPGFAYLGHHEAWGAEWLPESGFPYVKPDRLSERNCHMSGSEAPIAIPAACKTVGFDTISRRPAIIDVGDSLAFADWGMLAHGYEAGAFDWAALSEDGCRIGNAGSATSGACRRYWAVMEKRIESSARRGDFVLVASFWPLKKSSDYSAANSQLEAIVKTADNIGARVIVQAPLPQFKRDAVFCTPEWFRSNYDGCSIRKDEFLSQRASVMLLLEDLQRRHSGTLLIWDPTEQLCNAGWCHQFDRSGGPIFRNWDHLSYRGARSLGPAFEAYLKNIPPMQKLPTT